MQGTSKRCEDLRTNKETGLVPQTYYHTWVF
jgi:hypothetical protein